MNRVIIDKPCTLAVKNSTIVIDEGTKIPLKLVDFLILHKNVRASLAELAAIAKNETTVLIVTSRPKEFLYLYKYAAKNADLKRDQYSALKHKTAIAKEILSKKILRSYENLLHFNLDVEKEKFLKEIRNAESVQELLGIEGHLSKEYFRLFFTLFPKVLAKGQRTKNPPQDPINALLSYIYTIFYYEISTWLHFYGFEPLIGYLHEPFRDHMALSSDILEIFRARIDRFCADTLLSKEITLKDFTKKNGAVYLTDKGRKKLWTTLKPFLESQENAIKNEISSLRKIIKSVSSSEADRG
jgi:CRISPR-associated protein Cas1